MSSLYILMLYFCITELQSMLPFDIFIISEKKTIVGSTEYGAVGRC